MIEGWCPIQARLQARSIENGLVLYKIVPAPGLSRKEEIWLLEHGAITGAAFIKRKISGSRAPRWAPVAKNIPFWTDLLPLILTQGQIEKNARPKIP